MAKDKKGSKAVSAAPAPAASKPLETVKAGRVAKPVETVKAAAKDAAKKVAKEVEKKSKKAKKEPTPEPSSDEEDDTSDSSASSDDESNHTDDAGSDSSSSSDSDSGDEAFAKKAVLPKVNGATKAAADDDDDDTSSGSSSDGDEAPKVNGKARAAVDNDEGSDDDSGSSSGSSESDSDDEGVDVKAGAKKVKTNGVKADDSDSSSASSDDEESDEEEVPKAAEPVKKRKAEDAFDQTPKKTKMVNVDGENKEAASNLFIGNLSWNVDEEWLTREFEEFGEITGVRVITDRDTGRSKGYGYVDFVQVDSAIKALEEKNGEMLDGRNIRIDFSLPRQPKTDNFTPQQRSTDRAQRYGDTPKEPSKTLFVGNVSFDADESMLSDIFQEYGTITAVRLPTDRETEQLKGYGYVDFTNVDEAKAAFEALQGADVAGRPIRLDYASQRSNDSPRGGFGSRGGFGGGRGAPRGRGGFSDRGGGRGGRGGFGDRGRGRGAPRGGRGGTTNRGGFGDFSGKKISF